MTGTPAAALAIVPVDLDDGTAPLGCGALRELRGRPLLGWAVAALTASGAVRHTLVAVPPALEEAVSRALTPLAGEGLGVVPVQANGPGHRMLAALRSRPPRVPTGADGDVVVVHDPLHPLSSPELVRRVVEGLLTAAGCAGCAPARPVTDTLKWVDEDDVVRATLDRDGYRMIYSPQAYRRRPLLDALTAATDASLRAPGADVVPRLVQERGGRVMLVPSPGEAFRVASEDDLVLLEALLRVRPTDVRGAGTRGSPAGAPREEDPAGT